MIMKKIISVYKENTRFILLIIILFGGVLVPQQQTCAQNKILQKQDWCTPVPVNIEALKQAKAFEDGVPSAQILKLRGMHYIFISNETEVINAIRQFILRLK